MPLGTFQEVHEVDAQGLFGLAQLPVGAPATALSVVAEPAYLVGERFVGRGTHEKTDVPTVQGTALRSGVPVAP
jgi:hypothetical protein